MMMMITKCETGRIVEANSLFQSVHDQAQQRIWTCQTIDYEIHGGCMKHKPDTTATDDLL